MKRNILIIGLLLFIQSLYAQKDYKVVFDLTSKDTLDHKSVIRWLNEISKSNPDAMLEVVMYGQGPFFVVKDNSAFSDQVTKLLMNKNISFKVCESALKNQKIDKSLLLPGVQTVPDGIYEIVSKQHDGWGYIKATH